MTQTPPRPLLALQHSTKPNFKREYETQRASHPVYLIIPEYSQHEEDAMGEDLFEEAVELNNDTYYAMTAAAFSCIVEKSPLYRELREYGATDLAAAPTSSDAAQRYVDKTVANQFIEDFFEEDYLVGGIFDPEDGSMKRSHNLHLVKKVYCHPDDFEDMAEAISFVDADKFNVTVHIGADTDHLGFDENADHGMHYYLTTGNSKTRAYRNTQSMEAPTLRYDDPDLDPAIAERIDRLATYAFYNHTPELIRNAEDAGLTFYRGALAEKL